MQSLSQANALICRELADRAEELLYHLDSEGRLVYLNRSGARQLETEGDDWSRHSIMDFVHEDDRSRLKQALQSALDTGGAVRDLELRMVGMRCGQLTTRHELYPLDANDRSAGICGIACDLGVIRRLEDQLHQSQKLETIGLLAGGIAHDFNNMLAAILGFTELMIEERSADDPDMRTLNYIQRSTERAAALVRQLLLFSRKSTAELKPIRLGEVVQETIGIIERTLPKNIRIVAIADDAADTVMGDAGRIQQALMNLCLNARDAMPRGGELRIAVETMETVPGPPSDASATGNYLRVKVQDTGMGMTPEVLEKIWEPFYTTKEPGQGTGLGLAVVQSILAAHGGYAQVESQPGSGTSFYLYFPAAPANTPSQPAGLAEPPGGSETVLVVDDEEILIDLLVDILGRKGYRVLAASSGPEALEIVSACGDRIDLVISDNMMPAMMGRDLVAEIKRISPETRIVLCSGYAAAMEAEPAEPDFVSAYVQKPYQRRELLTRVREVLDSSLS
jgi:two-component system, cell cycle sensor histidine kinase and response regulator CckA